MDMYDINIDSYCDTDPETLYRSIDGGYRIPESLKNEIAKYYPENKWSNAFHLLETYWSVVCWNRVAAGDTLKYSHYFDLLDFAVELLQLIED